MINAIISGDIIAYTSLNKKGKNLFDNKILALTEVLKKEFNVFVRLIKGDYIECYVPETYEVLRVTLIIKSYIKTIVKEIAGNSKSNDDRTSLLKKYGIRLAIGIGELSRLDIDKGIIDGEAIYFSGRLLSKKSTSDKNKISIKDTLYLQTNNENLTNEFIPLISLIDEIINRNTAKQSEILYYKLLGFDEKSIAKKTGRYQSTVNQHSTSAGWNAIEKAVLRFEKVIKEKVK
ncbi:MAG: RNA polymerase subunit sigma-70 [Bacteroidales bacterium]|nr:RNA polymerase subunit sigma-70 [Bacteroidales bacterium]